MRSDGEWALERNGRARQKKRERPRDLPRPENLPLLDLGEMVLEGFPLENQNCFGHHSLQMDPYYVSAPRFLSLLHSIILGNEIPSQQRAQMQEHKEEEAQG